MKYVKRKVYVKRVKSIIKMSDNKDKKDIVFVKGNAKKITFNNGGSILNVSLNVKHLQKILDWYNNERSKRDMDKTDYIPLSVKEKRETDEYGNTHYVIYDPWFPDSSKKSSSKVNVGNAKPEVKEESTDDLPF